jgi:hypothetical protein
VSVHPQVLWASVRLLGDDIDQDGNLWHGTLGTGFVLHVPSELIPGVRHGYLITAAHVVRDRKNLEMQPAKQDGTLFDPIPTPEWLIPEPNLDLAISPMSALPDGEAYWGNPVEMAVPVGAFDSPMPGDSIYYVGVFAPLDRIMLRAGTIGAVDEIGVPVSPYDYPCHLVDCRSYGGFSGSPCFLVKDIPDLRPSGWPLPDPFGPPVGGIPGSTTHLVIFTGMFTAHFTDDDDHLPGHVTSRYGVGVMLRSQEIRAVLLSPAFAAMRAEREADVAAKISASGPGPKLAETSVRSASMRSRVPVTNDGAESASD